MSYMVIGSNCFTGSHIVDALLGRNLEVHGVSRAEESDPLYLPYKGRDLSRFTFHQIDVFRQGPMLIDLLEAVKPTHVIHVAALSEVNLSNFQPVEYFEINTTATVKLAHHLRQSQYLERYVHISSAEVYGSCANAILETAPLNPSTPYAVSKAAADLFLMTLQRNFDFPVNLVRSTNVYGKHQQLFKIIPRTYIYMRQGKKIPLQGGGTSIKHFIHIRDVVDGILAILDADCAGETFHFSTDNDMNVAQVIGAVAATADRRLEDVVEMHPDRLGQDSRYWLDCTKSRNWLGWKPRVEFRDSLPEIRDWIDANWEKISAQPLDYRHRT